MPTDPISLATQEAAGNIQIKNFDFPWQSFFDSTQLGQAIASATAAYNIWNNTTDEEKKLIGQHTAQLREKLLGQIAAQNTIESTGVIVTPTDNLQVRVTGALKTVKDLEDLELRANGTTFRLGDFATIKREYQDPPQDKMRFNGKEVIGLGVSMEKGGNIIKMGKGLDETVANIRAKLPVGIELQRVSDQPRAVKASVNEFIKVLVEAIVIVLAGLAAAGAATAQPAAAPADPAPQAWTDASATSRFPGRHD